MVLAYPAILLIATILFGTFCVAIPYIQVASALNKFVYFHFQGISLFGNSVILRVTGSQGEYQQWREWIAPVIGGEMNRQINTGYGFKQGEKVTACVTDVTTQLKSCYSTKLNFNSGTDVYLTIRGK